MKNLLSSFEKLLKPFSYKEIQSYFKTKKSLCLNFFCLKGKGWFFLNLHSTQKQKFTFEIFFSDYLDVINFSMKGMAWHDKTGLKKKHGPLILLEWKKDTAFKLLSIRRGCIERVPCVF